MSDQTVRETPTEALGGDGLPSSATKPSETPPTGSAGTTAPGEAPRAGPSDPGRAVTRKPAPPAKGNADASGARDQKAQAQNTPGNPHGAVKLNKQAADNSKKRPPVPRARPMAGTMLDASEATHAALGIDALDAAKVSDEQRVHDEFDRVADREPPPRAQATTGAGGPPQAASVERDSLSEALQDEPTLESTPASEESATEAKAAHAAEQETHAEEEPPRRIEVALRLFGRTDVGQVREHNEDNFIVADLTKASRSLMDADRYQIVGDRGALLGVCDGMGGAAAGEVASQLAVDIIYQRMSAGGPPNDHDELAARLVQSIEAAGLRIFSEAKLDRTRRGMGTTSTIAALMDDHLFLGQVGDSRAYILRGDRLVQVTRDQSLVNQLIEAGQLTEEEAETFEHNNIILQALGTADTVQVDLTYVQLKKGDTLMLCSDGLSGMVRNEEIREVLRTADDPLDACKVLTDRANQAGGHDNITVVVAKFDGEDLEAPTRDEIEALCYQKYQIPEQFLAAIGAASEPARRVKELEEKKISQRPPASKSWLSQPDIDARDDGDGYDDLDGGAPPRLTDDRLAEVPSPGDEPILIPTDGAPRWLVIMMIASAVACVTIAGYYLLR